MNLKHPIFAVSLAAIGISLSPVNVFAINNDFAQLLDNVMLRQPEQQTIAGIQELQTANNFLSESWISGDVDLLVHHENDVLSDNEHIQNWQVGLEFPIWLGTQKNAQRKLSASFQQQVPAHQNYFKWLASGTLRQLIWKFRKAITEVESAQSALLKSRALQIKVQQKVKAGESPKLDLLLANKAMLEQQNRFVEKQSALAIAQNHFQKWTLHKQLPTDILESLQTAVPLEQHPNIIKLKTELQLSESTLEQVKSFKKESPRVYLGAQNNKERSNSNTSLVFEVSIPLGINPSYSVKVAQQKSTIFEKQAILENRKIQLEEKIYQTQQALASSKLSIQFSQQQYQLSQKALAMSEQAYQLGETNIQNLLLVQQQTLEAKSSYELAKVRFGHTIANLNQVSGHIIGAE